MMIVVIYPVILLLSCYMILHNFFTPLIFRFLSVFLSNKEEKEESFIKKISVVLPVFNEEKQIADKLSNTVLCLGNSKIPYEALIGCDGSHDSTPEIAERFINTQNLDHFKLFKFDNEGKGQTINKLVKKATGDLIISTDCDTQIEPGSIESIITAFNEDGNLGCLSCIPVFQSKNMGIQNRYWAYELKIRDNESKLGKLIVVTGWLYAFRKSVFRKIPSGAMADDLWIPLTILLQGYKSIHLQSVKCLSEETDENTEVKRRKRVITGGVDIVRRLYWDLLKHPVLFFIVFSHKMNRWLLPFWLSLFIITSIAISRFFLFLYIGLFLLLTVYWGPKQLFSFIFSISNPIFSIIEAFRRSDLSKWNATRIDEANKKK